MTNDGKILRFPDDAASDAAAAAWVARFDAGNISAKDQAEFQAWLSRSARHREAIASYGNLWAEFDALRLLTHANQTETAARSPILRESARLWLAACAAVVVAILGGTLLYRPNSQRAVEAQNRPVITKLSTAPARLSYETAVGRQKWITLADGSSVILNTNSRLDVDFSAKCRDVHLVRGEAYFEVVHNKARPFNVYASKYVVRDIGTAFNVHLSQAGLLEVGVTKGSVEVAPANVAHAFHAAKNLSVVVAGQDIVLGRKIERTEAISSADMGRKLAWRQGELIYTGQPLGTVLDDVSRYSNIKIELADPALKSLPVGGAFRTDQIEAIFAALQSNFGIRAEWIDPQHVRFTSDLEKARAKN